MYLLTAILLCVVGLSTQQTDYCSPNLCPNGGPHIACNGLKTLSSFCGAGAREIRMNPTYKDHILHIHNLVRTTLASGKQPYQGKELFPPAARMGTLQWDQELANIAAANVRRCQHRYDYCRSTVKFPYAGQNIASFTNITATTVSDAIKDFVLGWYAEVSNVTPAMIAKYPRATPGVLIGGFAQLFSDRITRVGCALVQIQRTRTSFFFVCNYSASKIIGAPVYVAGPVGSKCVTGRNPQYKELCNPDENIA